MGGTICVWKRDKDQVARALLWLPWYIVNRMLRCIESAEAKIGKAPSAIEVFMEMKTLYPDMPINDVY
jgi:hypothetical protein